MEPDVIRIYSSSPPPMEDGAEEEDDEFGDFGTFPTVPNSISITEFDTPTTFNQSQALTATSPPELLNSRGVTGFNHSTSNGTHSLGELSKANGHLGSSSSDRTDMKKVLSNPLVFSAGSESPDCNGGGNEVLTNGFDSFQGSPSLQSSVHSHIKGMSTEDGFANFAAFSNAERCLSQTGGCPVEVSCPDEHCNPEQGVSSEDNVRDTHRTGSSLTGSYFVSVPAQAPGGSCNTDRGPCTDSQQRDVAFAQELCPLAAVCTNKALTLNGVGVAERDDSKEVMGSGENELSTDSEVGQLDEKASVNETETETETETSLGRPLSTDALEEYGDMSTTGSVPSPPLQGETATPADHSQLAEDDEDEDFGDFGDVASFGGQGFADFEQLEVQTEQSSSAAASAEDDDFGDFNSPRFTCNRNEGADTAMFTDFHVSDSFGNFSTAAEDADGEVDTGWSAFGEQEQVEGESWAAFSTEQTVAPPADSKREEEEEEDDEWHESEATEVTEDTSRTDSQSVRTHIMTSVFH